MQWNTLFFVCFCFYTASICNAEQQSSEPQLNRTVLNIVTIPNPPFTSVLTEGCEGNACFEGYAIDLIKELSRIIGFDYRIKLSDDGRYGMQSNGTWQGMIGEVADGRADLAVADLTITSKRREVVDFSYPFMTTGISILYKKVLIPQVQNLEPSIASAEDLSLQTQVKYGTVAWGSTKAFFEQSSVPTYARLWKAMESDPENFVSSKSEGIAKVKQGNYALFTEAAFIEYITERNCDLAQVGGLLDTRAYGIAMKKDSNMRENIDVALLQLQESGFLRTLKNRWWRSTESSCH